MCMGESKQQCFVIKWMLQRFLGAPVALTFDSSALTQLITTQTEVSYC